MLRNTAKQAHNVSLKLKQQAQYLDEFMPYHADIMLNASCIRVLPWLKQEETRNFDEQKASFGWLLICYLGNTVRYWQSCWPGHLNRTDQFLKACNTRSYPSYHLIIANTSTGAAILYFGHPDIRTYYCSSLVMSDIKRQYQM